MRKRTEARISLAAIALAAAITAIAGAAAADEVALRPRYQVGDRYALALATETKTRVEAVGAATNSFHESVELRYSAEVEILATDAAGAPLRERHENVDLRYTRPEGTKQLFAKGASFELTRRAEGGVEILFRGERVEPRIEQIVGDLLAHQSEYAVAALLDPGRPVAVGERWELDPGRVRDFLGTRGIREVDLDGAATAQLESGKGGQLALRYRIPIAGFELKDMPEGASRSDSKGSLEGQVELAGAGFHRAKAHSSELALHIDGAMRAPGIPRAARWSLRRSQSVEQHTETLKDQLASTR